MKKKCDCKFQIILQQSSSSNFGSRYSHRKLFLTTMKNLNIRKFPITNNREKRYTFKKKNQPNFANKNVNCKKVVLQKQKIRLIN